MLKGDAQYSREEVVEVSSLSRNWCAWVALGLALGLDISSASAFVLLCFSASPHTLGLGHPLGLTLGLRVGLALVWASLDHPHSIALLVRPFITSQWATWSEKHQTLNKWTPSCWPILWCFLVSSRTTRVVDRHMLHCYMLTGTCYLRRKSSPCEKSWRNEKLQCRCLFPSSFILSFNIAIMAFTISFHKTPF